jgi:hypothetical protein
MIVLPALAGTVAGCADSNFASSNASMQTSSDTARTQREPAVQVGYGMSSDGPTTDLYTELFRHDEAPAAPAAVAQGQPAAGAPTTIAQGRPGSAVAQNQPAMASNAAPPAPAGPPPEPTTQTAFGLSSNGPTTDLYTELFGKNR